MAITVERAVERRVPPEKAREERVDFCCDPTGVYLRLIPTPATPVGQCCNRNRRVLILLLRKRILSDA
jgi:hypothetical protein